MSKSENPRFVFFLFIHSKRVAADFSLPRARCLPFPLCCLPRTRGALQCAIAFFFLSTRFATSLTFVFRSFSSASRIKREFSGLSADVDPLSSSTSSPCSSTRAPSALERKISLRRRGFRLYDSKGTSPRTTRPLPSSRRRRRSAPHHTDVEIGEPKVRFLFFLFPHSKRVAAAFSLPRARCLPSSLCCLPRIRGHASSPLLFFFLSTRFATSLTFVFRSFPKLLASSASSPAQQSLSADVDPLSSYILALPLDASTVGTRAEDLSPSTGIPAAVLKQALYDSKGTSPRSTRPLPSSRRRRSAPHRQGQLSSTALNR